MKLNINAKELLALYNVLYERFDGRQAYDTKAEGEATDETQLRQVYNRLRAIIVAGLTNPGKVVDPVDSWLKHEAAKIDDLQKQNEDLKTTARDPGNFVPVPVDPGSILTDDEDEVPSDLPGYPKRRGAPSPHMPHHGGKHRGRRK